VNATLILEPVQAPHPRMGDIRASGATVVCDLVHPENGELDAELV
jgi:4-aminobutyrate aminotransferase-like enzyme